MLLNPTKQKFASTAGGQPGRADRVATSLIEPTMFYKDMHKNK